MSCFKSISYLSFELSSSRIACVIRVESYAGLSTDTKVARSAGDDIVPDEIAIITSDGMLVISLIINAWISSSLVISASNAAASEPSILWANALKLNTISSTDEGTVAPNRVSLIKYLNTVYLSLSSEETYPPLTVECASASVCLRLTVGLLNIEFITKYIKYSLMFEPLIVVFCALAIEVISLSFASSSIISVVWLSIVILRSGVCWNNRTPALTSSEFKSILGFWIILNIASSSSGISFKKFSFIVSLKWIGKLIYLVATPLLISRIKFKSFESSLKTIVPP